MVLDIRPRPSQPRLRVDTIPENQPDAGSISSLSTPEEKRDYPHTSVFRSPQAEIQVRSHSVKVARQRNSELAQSFPVFGDHDRVEGVVLLDSALCTTPGRLTISMEGAFLYISPGKEAYDDPFPDGHGSRVRHTFFLSSMVNLVGGLGTQRSTSSLREAFAASVRSRRRSPSEVSISGALRPFPFSFEMPRSNQAGEEMPPSFSSIAIGEAGIRSRTCVERVEVTYRIFVTWETSDEEERTLLEAPILYHPETDFQSLDGSMEPDSWIEIPLQSERPIPFKCAVTTPTPATFSRSASIPYFVVFTTTPRSHLFAREIAADATIVVSLVREVTIDAPTPSSSPVGPSSTSSDESDIPRTQRRGLLKRYVKSAPTVIMHRIPSPDKPLPQLPERISDTRTLQTDVCIGFPKRPRHRHSPDQKHPPLDAHLSLPDGLYKGRIQLDRDLLPEVNWSDFSIKYYIETSVVFGQDELRARVPVRIY